MKAEACFFGIGLGFGFIGGLLLMNNSKSVRNKVAETQDVVVDKLETTKREMAQEFAEDMNAQPKKPQASGASVKSKTKAKKSHAKMQASGS